MSVKVVVFGLWLNALFLAGYLLEAQWAWITALAVGLASTLAFIPWFKGSLDRLSEAVGVYFRSGEMQALRDVAGKDEAGRIARELLDYYEAGPGEGEMIAGAVQSMSSPLLVYGSDGIVAHATSGMLSLLRRSREQVVGSKAGQALFGSSDDSLIMGPVRSGASVARDADLDLWDGRTLPVSLNIDPVRDKGNEVIGAVLAMFDRSALQAGQEEYETEREHFQATGAEIRELAQRVASASEELSASADEQARGAVRQKNQTDTVATAMEEMTSTVLEVARNASATSMAADEARTSAREGVDLVSKAVTGINNVAESAQRLSQDLAQLDSQAEEIGRIISVINDIADQTNLLALNAAIEAARAGEAGRGFAVVADEVRKLAEKTVTATKEVEDAIRTIQQRSTNAMESMKQTEKQVGESTDLSNRTGESLQQIMERIEDMVMRVTQIATAAEEQSAAAEEINHSIEEIASIAHEAEEGASQAAAATRDLAELSQELLSVSMEFSGKEGGRPRLRSSKTEMRGVLPKLTQEFIKSEYSGEVYRHMREEMGDPVFLPTASYPDQVMTQMAEIVADVTKDSVRDFFLKLGRFTVREFHRMYKRHFKDETLKQFYLRMNDVHSRLTKDQPGIKPPTFTYEDKGDVLFMNYHSRRGLFDYFEGILRGSAEFKKEKVDIKLIPMDEKTARAEITFRG